MKKINKLQFTGERLIPELNKKAAFYYEHLAHYLFAFHFVKNKVVLDAGCGVGYGSYILANNGKAQKVFAIDLSADAIKYAQNKYSSKNIKYKKDNILKLKTIDNKSIDIAVNFEVIEHINKQDKFLSQIKRVLTKDGVFVVSTPNKYNYPEGNSFHTKELYPQEFFELLKKYFKNVSFFHQNFEFTQTIKPEDLKENQFLNERLSILEVQTYTSRVNAKNSQYIIALCSDQVLPKTKLLAINSQKIDSFDLTRGLLTLSGQIHDLFISVEMLKSKNEYLQKYLHKIESSKFFKLWQSYCQLRDKLLNIYDKN